MYNYMAMHLVYPQVKQVDLQVVGFGKEVFNSFFFLLFVPELKLSHPKCKKNIHETNTMYKHRKSQWHNFGLVEIIWTKKTVKGGTVA